MMNFFQIIKKLVAPMPQKSLGRNLSLQDREDIKRKWTEVEQNIKLGKPSNFKNAVMEADKILDHVLILMGFKGQTMADRMKSISRNDHDRDFFNDMWQAHLLRNTMVHNLNYEVMNFEANKAVKQFERVLRELGAL